MNRSLALLVMTALSMSYAQNLEDSISEMSRKLYASINKYIFPASNSAIGKYFVMANPGYLLDNTMDISKVGDRVAINGLIDRAVGGGYIYNPLNYSIYDAYMAFIREAMVREYSPTSGDVAERNSIYKLLYKGSPNESGEFINSNGYANYLKLKGEFENAEQDLQEWRMANPGKPDPSAYTNKVNAARIKLVTAGQESTYANAEFRLAQLGENDPNSYFRRIRNQAEDSAVLDNFSGRKYPKNIYYPQYSTWFDASRSWQQVSISSSNIETTTVDGSSSGSIGGGARFGFWSLGGGGQTSSQWKMIDSATKKFELSFQILRVNIDRPWLNSTFFTSNAWRWKCTTTDPLAGKDISGGKDILDLMNAEYIMPFLPTEIIIARKLNIKSSLSQNIQSEINEQSSKGARVSFGPFRLGGGGSKNERRTFSKATVNDESITFEDPQIIGFIVNSVPKSPNPSDTYTFKTCNN